MGAIIPRDAGGRTKMSIPRNQLAFIQATQAHIKEHGSEDFEHDSGDCLLDIIRRVDEILAGGRITPEQAEHRKSSAESVLGVRPTFAQ